jgi:predicted GIY-YIG superfamily endonuclease
MYAEYYERIDEAFAREKQIQKWSRKKKEALIEGNFEKLRCLSKSHFDRLSDHTSDRLSDHTFNRLSDYTSDRLSDHTLDKLGEQHTSERLLSSEYDEGRCLSLSNGRCLSLSKAEL